MINKWCVHREHDWVVLSFPRQGKTLLWNDTNKSYDFYEGLPWEKEKLKETVIKKNKDYEKMLRWEKIAFILGGSLVAAIAAVIVLITMVI
mgnify:CR=1 FL=1